MAAIRGDVIWTGGDCGLLQDDVGKMWSNGAASVLGNEVASMRGNEVASMRGNDVCSRGLILRFLRYPQ